MTCNTKHYKAIYFVSIIVILIKHNYSNTLRKYIQKCETMEQIIISSFNIPT